MQEKQSDIKKASMSQVNNYQLRTGATLSFWVYLPEVITDNMPLIVFWHGSGECGNNLPYLKDHTALVKNLYNKQIGTDAIIIMPNFKYSKSDMVNRTMPLLQDFLEGKFVTASGVKLSVDPNKLAIIGFSLGTNAILKGLSATQASLFSVCVIISGQTSNGAQNFVNTKGFLAMAGSEEVDNAQHTKKVADTINKYGGHAEYREYPKKDHSTVTWEIFKNNEILDWIMSKF